MNQFFDAKHACRSLIGSMTFEEFNHQVREIHWKKFDHAFDSAAVQALFSLSRLEAMLQTDSIPLDYVDVFDRGFLRRLADLQRKSGKSSLEAISQCVAQGSSIRVRDLDRFDGRVAELAGQMRSVLQAQVQCNLYLTPRAEKGFPPHFDITDVFVVQCSGSKCWGMFPDYSEMTPLPLSEAVWDPQRSRPISEPVSVTMQSGDVLYLPRGVMHKASCIDQESLHLSFSVASVTVADLLVRAVGLLASRRIEFRRRLPLGPEGCGAEAHAQTLRRLFEDAVDDIDFSELLNEALRTHRTAVIGPLKRSGSLLEALNFSATHTSSDH